MKRRFPRQGAAALLAIAVLTGPVSAQEKEPPAAPAAEAASSAARAIMERASVFLAEAKQISFKAETTQELMADNGMKVQMAKEVEVRLRRPDRLKVLFSTQTPSRSIWYDGSQITLLDHRRNLYASSPAPDKIDAMVHDVEKNLGVVFPLDDLTLTKPFMGPAASAKSSLYLGLDKVMGRTCHHVAFQHEAIDWQAWVEDGPKPLLRKLVITYKLDEGSPQYVAHFPEWDLGTKLPDYLFTFEAPPGAMPIKMLPAKTDEGPAAPEKKEDH